MTSYWSIDFCRIAFFLCIVETRFFFILQINPIWFEDGLNEINTNLSKIFFRIKLLIKCLHNDANKICIIFMAFGKNDVCIYSLFLLGICHVMSSLSVHITDDRRLFCLGNRRFIAVLAPEIIDL